MIGKVSAVVLAGLLVAAAAAAPEALARRGSGWVGRSGACPGVQQGNCRGDCDRSQQNQRDGSCLRDPSQCPQSQNCPGPGTGSGTGPGPQGRGPQDGTGKGAVNR